MSSFVLLEAQKPLILLCFEIPDLGFKSGATSEVSCTAETTRGWQKGMIVVQALVLDIVMLMW